MNKVVFSQKRPEDSLGFMFWQVTLKWQNKLQRALKPLGLTHIQFVLLINLAWLMNTRAHINQVQLSKMSGVNIMMVSKVCRVLEKKGLIERKNGTDAREKNLVLRGEGVEKAQQALSVVEQADEAYFMPLKDGYHLFIKALKLLAGENASP